VPLRTVAAAGAAVAMVASLEGGPLKCAPAATGASARASCCGLVGGTASGGA
jgi:hypothetical protein